MRNDFSACFFDKLNLYLIRFKKGSRWKECIFVLGNFLFVIGFCEIDIILLLCLIFCTIPGFCHEILFLILCLLLDIEATLRNWFLCIWCFSLCCWSCGWSVSCVVLCCSFARISLGFFFIQFRKINQLASDYYFFDLVFDFLLVFNLHIEMDLLFKNYFFNFYHIFFNQNLFLNFSQ